MSADGSNWEGSQMRNMGVIRSTGGVIVATAVVVGGAGLVGAGVGVIRDASSGSREAQPALKNRPVKKINRKKRAMITNLPASAKSQSKA